MCNLSWWKNACVVFVLCAATAIVAPAQTYTTLLEFADVGAASSLVQAPDGNFYGTMGGGNYSYGIVFKVTPQGLLTALYSFCAQPSCPDGEYPDAGLVLATDGNFYVTTYNGGASGQGTVFRISPGGTLTTLHSFDIADGSEPLALI